MFILTHFFIIVTVKLSLRIFGNLFCIFIINAEFLLITILSIFINYELSHHLPCFSLLDLSQSDKNHHPCLYFYFATLLFSWLIHFSHQLTYYFEFLTLYFIFPMSCFYPLIISQSSNFQSLFFIFYHYFLAKIKLSFLYFPIFVESNLIILYILSFMFFSYDLAFNLLSQFYQINFVFLTCMANQNREVIEVLKSVFLVFCLHLLMIIRLMLNYLFV